MAVKDLISELDVDVADVISTSFNYYITDKVPRRTSAQLTFESGVEKRGLVIETCVLFVDIRNSVGLTEKHQSQTMGKIYTAFTKGVLKIAKNYDGHIRNIIGDRVMVVFPTNNCFTSAVNCAISINHFAKNVIAKRFTGVDFKCGIGIDYGKLRVIKVGIQRRGHENTENKALVWTGYPANKASRLTDVANKNIDETYFEVTRNPVNPKWLFGAMAFDYLAALGPVFPQTTNYNKNESHYLSLVETVEMSVEDFANSISSIKNGELYMTGGNFISFQKKSRKIRYPDILMTGEVYEGYKHANPTRIDVIDVEDKFWKEQTRQIKNVPNKVWGGDITWAI